MKRSTAKVLAERLCPGTWMANASPELLALLDEEFELPCGSFRYNACGVATEAVTKRFPALADESDKPRQILEALMLEGLTIEKVSVATAFAHMENGHLAKLHRREGSPWTYRMKGKDLQWLSSSGWANTSIPINQMLCEGDNWELL
jgi:hypothetical protein